MRILLFILFLSSTCFSGETLPVFCGESKNLILPVGTEADCDLCNRSSLMKTPDEALSIAKKLKEGMQISYPFQGPNRAIKSPNYDVETIKKLVELALVNDIDPYLLLSISLLESPPVRVVGGRGNGYEYGYGDLPIDALPLYDMLGCTYKKPKDNSFLYASSDQVQKFAALYGENNKLKQQVKNHEKTFTQFRNFVVKETGGEGNHIYRILTELRDGFQNGCPIKGIKKEISERYCSDSATRRAVDSSILYDQSKNDIENSLHSGELSELQVAELGARMNSSATTAVIPNKSVPEFQLTDSKNPVMFLCADPAQIEHGVRSRLYPSSKAKESACCAKVMGFKNLDNLKNEFLNFMAARFIKLKISTEKGPLSSLALDIQKYNGLGVLGSTEGVGNDCLDGLNMKERPYYGARAADLIVNSLLSNDELNSIVQSLSKKLKKPIKSVICQKLGAGTHQIERKQFLDQQKDFLISGRTAKEKTCSANFK